MTAPGNVPCGTCQLCCKYELIPIMPDDGDDLAMYEHDTTEVPNIGPVHTLKHKPNGDCVYLDESGCTIHGHAPKICREFDCRVWFLMYSRSQRRQMSAHRRMTKDVFTAGRARLGTLDR